MQPLNHIKTHFYQPKAPFSMYVKFSENHFISPDMHLVHVIIVGGAREKL